jgi:hypothetical protein
MHAVVHAADVQDRDGGVLLMGTIFGLYPFLLKLYADGGYQGAAFQADLQGLRCDQCRNRQALGCRQIHRIAQALDR